MTSLATAFVTIRPDTKMFGAQLSRDVDRQATVAGTTAGKKMGGKFSGALGMAAKTGGAALGAAAVFGAAAFGKRAVTLEAEFSKTMNLLQATTDTPKAGMKSLSDLAIKMGKDTVFSASDASKAMLELARGGMTAAQIKGGALAGTMTLAAAGEMEMGEAANVAVKAMGAFGLKAGQTSSVAAALAGAANASSASVRDLSQGLSQVSAVANDAGFTVQETTAALAALSNAGISGSDAGTSLKTMFANLVPQTNKAWEAMQSYGLATYNSDIAARELASVGIKATGTSFADTTKAIEGYLISQGVAEAGTNKLAKATSDFLKTTGIMHNSFLTTNGDFKSLTEISGILNQKLKGLSDSERATALSTLFGSDARRAATVLMNEGSTGLAKLIKQTSDQAAAEKVAGAAMKGTAGAMERLSGSVETVALQFGLMLKPVTIAGLNIMAGAVDLVSQGITKLSGGGGGGGGALGAVGKMFGTLRPVIADLAGTFKKELLPAFRDIMPIVGPIAGFLVKMFGSAVVGAIKGAAQVIKGFVQVLSGVFNLIADVLNGRWSQIWGNLKQIAAGFFNIIVGAIKVWFNVSILAAFRSGALALVKGWRGLWTNLRSWATTGFNWIKGVISKAFSAVTGLFVKAIKGYVGFWRGLFTTALNITRNGWQVMRSAFGGALAAIRTVISQTVTRVVGFWRGLFTTLRNATSSGMQNVKSGIDFVLGKIRGAFSGAIDGIGRIWKKLEGLAKAPVKFVIQTVYNEGIRKVVNAIPGVSDLGPVSLPKGFAEGGWTGPGSKMQPAGIVHADEHVWTKDEMRRFPGGHKAMAKFREQVLHGALGKLPGYFLGGGVKPAAGAVNRHSGYGWAKWAGDINEPGSADLGKPVVAWKGGTVASTKSMSTSYGNHIRVNHAGGERTLYAHLQGSGVRAGQSVKAGQRLGSKGSTGNSSGPHLHFEIAGGSNPINSGDVGGGGGGDEGHWVTKIIKKANPLRFFKLDDWKKKLGGMGKWGGMMGSAIGSLAGKFKGWAADKIKAAWPGAKDILSGKPQLSIINKVWSAVTGGGGPGTSNDSGAGGLMPLMEQARKYVQSRWGPMTIHGYSNRNIGGTNTKSDHAYGKALDLMGAKQDIADYFATGAGHSRFRIENTIYNRRIHNAQGWHAYNGSSPHTDHVHIDTYDTGGVLRSGAMAANRSGKPERVLSPGQTKAFDGLVALLSKGGMSTPERDLLARVTRGLWPALTKLLTKVGVTPTKPGTTPKDGATVRSGSFNAHTYGHKPARTIADLRKVLPKVDSLALQEWTNAAGAAAGYLREQGFGLFRGPTGTAIAWRKSRFDASRLGSHDLNKKHRMPKGTSQRHAVYGLLTDKQTRQKFWQISSHFIPGVGYFKGRVSKAKHAAIYREQQERLAGLSKRLSGSAPVIAGGDYNRRGNKIVGGLNTTTGNKIDQIYSNLAANNDFRIGGLNSDHDAVVSRYRLGTYDRGGVARGRGALVKDTLRPERVLSPSQTASFDRLVAVLERGGSPSSAPLIGNAVIRETVDLDRYERQRAFYERRMRVG